MSSPVKMERVLFFQDTSFAEGWQTRMIHAVAVAQRMGLGATELVVTPRFSERLSEVKDAHNFIFASIWGRAPEIEGDEWKNKQEGKARAKVEEFLIQLYALRVADVEWETR